MPAVPDCAAKLAGLSTSLIESVPLVLSTAFVSVRFAWPAVMTAGSLTGITAICETVVLLFAVPSLTVISMLRVTALGLSLGVLKPMPRSAV